METPPIQIAQDLRNEAQDPRSRGLFRATLAVIGVLSLILVFTFTWQREGEAPIQQAAAAQATQDAFADVLLTAHAAFVADLKTGDILFEKNPDSQLPLASLTKVPLILTVSEVLSENEEVEISHEAIERGEGGMLWFGEIWRVRDLMDLTLVASSNVGAEALAETAEARLSERYPESRGQNAVTWRMNDISTELALSQTYFLNPTGLDVSTTQAGAAGSARDMAVLFAYIARTVPGLFMSTAESDLSLAPLNAEAKVVHNTNEALPDIPGLVFGKTGFTDLAGGNLAIVFEVGPGRPVVAVILGSTQEGRFEDMRALVERSRAAIAQQGQSVATQ